MALEKKIKTNNDVSVVLTGDWHYGNKKCDETALRNWINWIKKTKSYVILMGDLMEDSIPAWKDGLGMPEQIKTPDEQFDDIFEILFPIRDRILCAVSGNHENRIYHCSKRLFGYEIDPIKDLCLKLGVPFLEDSEEDESYFILNVNNIQYAFSIFHGKGASQNPRMLPIKASTIHTDSDIVAIGHSHQLYHEIKIEKKIGYDKKVHLIRTGGFLEYPKYARESFFPPSIIGAPIVTLDCKRKNIRVDANGEIR